MRQSKLLTMDCTDGHGPLQCSGVRWQAARPPQPWRRRKRDTALAILPFRCKKRRRPLVAGALQNLHDLPFVAR